MADTTKVPVPTKSLLRDLSVSVGGVPGGQSESGSIRAFVRLQFSDRLTAILAVREDESPEYHMPVPASFEVSAAGLGSVKALQEAFAFAAAELKALIKDDKANVSRYTVEHAFPDGEGVEDEPVSPPRGRQAG